MAEAENLDDEFFADLYADDEPTAALTKNVVPERTSMEVSPQGAMIDDGASNNQASNGDARPTNEDSEEEEDDDDIDFNLGDSSTNIPSASGNQQVDTPIATHTSTPTPLPPPSKGPSAKEDGKMFIGGLNWETTDQSLRDYFSQFGEVVECTVMRDGATGRSRGFGFLTFKDPKTVNIVMVKEHHLDGKIIDPKRAIPRDEQEKTSKIFVGGVSQECTDQEFKEYFAQFGRVVDATLMMDKDTGRPRGFGFVTFESEAGVEACLSTHLEIHGKAIEVKKAQPRGNMREEEEAARRGAKFVKGKFGGSASTDDGAMQGAGGQNGGQNGNNMGMSPQVMAQAFQRMQAWMSMVQQQQMMMGGGRGMASINPAMMQQMMMQQQQMQMMGGGGRGQGNGAGPGGMMGGMNPAMMQQIMQAQQGGGPNGPGGGNQGGRPGYNAYEQQMYEQQKYEQQKYEQQQNRRGPQGGGGFQGGGAYGGGGNQNNWEGMYDDPQPGMMGGGGRGGFHRGPSRQQGPGEGPPANAPTGPKNAGKPGANLYRGGGRGGNRGFHPYSRP